MKPNDSPPNQEKIRKRYDSMAKSYNEVGQLLDAHRHDAMCALDVQSNDRILDLACGPAVNFKNISKCLGTNGLLVGLDYSIGMLSQTNEQVKRNKWCNVASTLGDGARLPFDDCVFDRVICTYSFNVIPFYKQALDEVWRILKMNGALVVLDGKLSNGALRFFNPLVSLMGRAPMINMARPLINEITLRFQNVQVTEYDFGYTFLAVAHKKSTIESG